MIPPDIEAVALLGWAVYPCSRSSKAGMFKGAHLAATCDLNTIAGWCREYSRCNWRVVFGKSGIWGLDCDTPPIHAHDGIAALAELVKVHGPLPSRPQARSGGGGLGLFFAHNGERIIGEGGNPAPGIDPRRGAQTQTIPPSIHIVTRKPYRWIEPPWRIAPPVAPAWLLRLVEPAPDTEYRHTTIDTTDKARNKLFRAASAVANAAPGDRNATLNRRAYQIGHMIGAGLLSEREGAEALYGAARTAGLDHAEIRATIISGINSGVRRVGR
jgi:hypothetical protein